MRRISAKQRKSRYRPTQQASTSLLPAWAWLITGLCLGLLASSLFYWKFHSPAYPVRQVKTQKESKKQQTATNNQKAKRTHFDFYTMLPTMKEEELSDVSEDTKIPQQYIIQAGSFRELEQAEELKAELALLGLEASIQTIKITEKDLCYRVYMGPFKTKEIAAAKQQQVEQAHELHSLILKFHV